MTQMVGLTLKSLASITQVWMHPPAACRADTAARVSLAWAAVPVATTTRSCDDASAHRASGDLSNSTLGSSVVAWLRPGGDRR